MKIKDRSYPTPFASEQSANDWIERHSIKDQYPDAHPKWMGFEYDTPTGLYFITFGSEDTAGYLAGVPENEHELAFETSRIELEWHMTVESRTLEENNRILYWLENEDSSGIEDWRYHLRNLSTPGLV